MTVLSRRQVGMQLGVAALGLGLPVRAFAAPPAGSPFDIMPYVHPELQPMVAPLLAVAHGAITAEDLPMLRKGSVGRARPPLPTPAWSERMVAGLRGAPDVRIFIINAKSDGSMRPAILHMHGGGFILGAAKSSLRDLQDTALALDCVIVTVDYRLAPETRFPGPLEDNYAALTWLYQHAAEIGADPARIAVMGESAGGGHAATLAIAARDRGEIPLIYQALTYPMLDDRTSSTVQKPPFMGVLVWTPAFNRFGWTSLLGVAAGSDTVPHGAVPARLDSLKGLPPAFIGVGSIDLFFDEDIEYARRLGDAGIAVELHVIPGAFHGFDGLPGTTIGPAYKATLIAALRRAFETPARRKGQP